MRILLGLVGAALFLAGLWAVFAGVPASGASARASDAPATAALRAAARSHGAGPLGARPRVDPAMAALGEALFFDPILSGNRDISCGSCHHPQAGSGDGLPLSAGTGGRGDGPARVLGPDRPLVPRNAPPIYNRGHADWRTMFWDGRVERVGGAFRSPAGDVLPGGLDSLLAVQAMFPPTSRVEMRGNPGETAADGRPNELAMIGDRDLAAIWSALSARVVAEPGYVPLLEAAFPGRDLDELGFADLANAIAAYEASAFVADGSPWDRFLAGDDAALADDELAGAALFYGDGGCAACHTGALMTDQRFHAAGVPQIGPGKDRAAPADTGRGAVTGAADDHAFRTPSLRNVAITGPWMHDGAYDSLEQAVRHMADAPAARRSYRGPVQPGLGRLAEDAALDTAPLDAAAESFGRRATPLSDAQVADVVAFLGALTDPASRRGEPAVPESVPSGLAPPGPAAGR